MPVINSQRLGIPYKFTTIQNKRKYLVYILTYIIIFLILINILIGIIDIYSHYYTVELYSNVIPEGDKNDNSPMDPVRWWPSGVPQGWAIVGTALATFSVLNKIPGVNPRLRVLGALGSAGVTASQITYHSAVENSVGFNRLMWGPLGSEYRRTGLWPSIDQIGKQITETQINDFTSEAIKHADESKVNSVVNEINGNGLLPFSNSDFKDLINQFIDLIFKETMQILEPVQVQGFLDDLIGQRMFIEIILFIMCISIILLFIFFIFNLIFLLNKDKIIKKFDNKFITFYIKYQAFLSKITLFYIPILISIGLFTLCKGLYWLVVNQIPYEYLGIDLHKFIAPATASNPALPLLDKNQNESLELPLDLRGKDSQNINTPPPIQELGVDLILGARNRNNKINNNKYSTINSSSFFKVPLKQFFLLIRVGPWTSINFTKAASQLNILPIGPDPINKYKYKCRRPYNKKIAFMNLFKNPIYFYLAQATFLIFIVPPRALTRLACPP